MPKKSAGKKPPQNRFNTQISVTMPPEILAELNEYKRFTSGHRSVFICVAVQEKIERLKKSEKTGQGS